MEKLLSRLAPPQQSGTTLANAGLLLLNWSYSRASAEAFALCVKKKERNGRNNTRTKFTQLFSSPKKCRKFRAKRGTISLGPPIWYWGKQKISNRHLANVLPHFCLILQADAHLRVFFSCCCSLKLALAEGSDNQELYKVWMWHDYQFSSLHHSRIGGKCRPWLQNTLLFTSQPAGRSPNPTAATSTHKMSK